MEQSGWDLRIATVTFGNDVYAFKPVGTTTIEDIVAQLESIREVIKSVITAVEQMDEGDEKLTVTDFMQCVLDTINENLVDATGNAMTLEPAGIGFSIVTINSNG